MDVREYFKEKERMCRSYGNYSKGCSSCPLDKFDHSDCHYDSELIIDTVEEWSKKHPVITRWQKFEEVFSKDHPILIGSETWWNEPYEEPNL